MRYVFVQDTYDGFAESISNIKLKGNGKFIKPDIVAVLNCGFIFYSSWDKSIPYLLKYPEVPLIFTEYYEEDSKYNLQKVDSLGIHYGFKSIVKRTFSILLAVIMILSYIFCF